MEQKHVVIIGSGIAGIMAAKQLAHTHTVIVLEASDRLGGRILPWQEGFSQTIDGGAEFVHGDAVYTMVLLKEAGISCEEITGEMYRQDEDGCRKQDEMIEGWDELLHKMEAVKDETTLMELLDKYFADAKHEDLRRQAVAYAGGFDLADAALVTVRSLYQEWSQPETNHRINGGYAPLLNYLLQQCRQQGVTFITNSKVTAVQWEKGNVKVIAGDATYTAQQCMVTIPISCLRQNTIAFAPAIDDYMAATNSIGFGKIVKVVVEFRERFWDEDMGFVFSEEAVPTWWSLLPDTAPVLAGWAGHDKAMALEHLSDDAIAQHSITSLSRIFHKSEAEIRALAVAIKIFNWQRNAYAQGGYSYAIAGTSAARRLLSTPVANTLFFAGEAVYDGPASGTVEAAIVSARLAANLVTEVL